MASEITATTLTNQILTELIQAQVGPAIREKSGLLPLCDVVDISGVPTNTASWQIHNVMTVDTITDGTAMTNNAYSQTNVTCAAAQYGVMFTMTDFGLNATVADHSTLIPANAIADVVLKIDQVIAALLDSFTGTTQQVGTSGTNLTVANMIDAATNLRINAQGLVDEMGATYVLHPRQLGDIMLASEGYAATGLTTTQAVGISPVLNRSDFIDVYGDGKILKLIAGSFLGIPIISSNLVPTANTAADRAGAIVVNKMAMAVAMKKLPGVELQRAISNGIPGWTGIVDTAFNAVELRDLAGVSIITDA